MKYEFTLCAGRHETPASQAIFEEIADPTDFEGMINRANEVIPADADELVVYVTGLTPAMLAVTKLCWLNGISLTAMHYDRETGKYLPQQVLKFETCSSCGRRYPAFLSACPACWG